jgi:hypothetical protein
MQNAETNKQSNLKVVFKHAEMRLLLLNLTKANCSIKLLAIVEARGGDICSGWVS